MSQTTIEYISVPGIDAWLCSTLSGFLIVSNPGPERDTVARNWRRLYKLCSPDERARIRAEIRAIRQDPAAAMRSHIDNQNELDNPDFLNTLGELVRRSSDDVFPE